MAHNSAIITGRERTQRFASRLTLKRMRSTKRHLAQHSAAALELPYAVHMARCCRSTLNQSAVFAAPATDVTRPADATTVTFALSPPNFTSFRICVVRVTTLGDCDLSGMVPDLPVLIPCPKSARKACGHDSEEPGHNCQDLRGMKVGPIRFWY